MKRNKLQQGRSISAGGHESRLDEFSSSGRLFLFHRSGKQRKLLHVRHQCSSGWRFPGCTGWKNGNAAFEAFGRLGESGIVAIAVEDQVKIIGAVVPGFYVPAFCGFAPFGKNRGHFGFQLFSAFDLLR